jgi:hypothetical protein
MTGSGLFHTYFFNNNFIRKAVNFGFKMCFTTCGYVTFGTICMLGAAVELEACNMVAVIAVVCHKQEMVSRMKGVSSSWLCFWRHFVL